MTASASSARLSFARSLAVSVGMALATSCFAMIAGMAAQAGPWLLVALALSLPIVLAVAQAIGRLARRFPSALGIRTYIKAAFGNTASLFFVFLYMAMIALVASVESNLYASIVQQVFPAADARGVVLAVFAAVFGLNAFGHEFSRHAQGLLVGAMLAGITALSLCALALPPAAGAAVAGAAWPPVATLPAAAIGSFFLFVGFEWVTSSQTGSRQAAAQLPRVLLAAVGLLGVVYLLFIAAALSALGSDTLAGTRTPQMLLAARLWGEPGRWAMLAVSTAAVLMAFNAGVLGASRLVYGLAREGCLPPALTRTLPSNGAPITALASTVGASLACSLVTGLLHAGDLLGQAAAVIICLCYAALLAASLVLARRAAGAAFSWRTPANAVEAAALLAMGLLLAALLSVAAAWRPAALACAAGAVCALLAVRLNARHAPAAAPAARHPVPITAFNRKESA